MSTNLAHYLRPVLSPNGTTHPYTSRVCLFLPLVLGATLAGYLPWLLGETTDTAGLPGLVPAFALVIGIKLWVSVDHHRPQRYDKQVALALSTFFLIPSYQLGWMIILIMAIYLWVGAKHNPRLRTALSIIAMATLQPLLTTYLLKWGASTILTFDAWLVANLLQLFTATGSHIGNIVYGPADHQLMILRGCSSIGNLGSTWLAWYALSRYRGIGLGLRETIVLLLLTLSVVGLNLLRLLSMALDLHWHAWWHAPVGAQVFSLSSTGLLIISIVIGIRYVSTRSRAPA